MYQYPGDCDKPGMSPINDNVVNLISDLDNKSQGYGYQKDSFYYGLLWFIANLSYYVLQFNILQTEQSYTAV